MNSTEFAIRHIINKAEDSGIRLPPEPTIYGVDAIILSIRFLLVFGDCILPGVHESPMYQIAMKFLQAMPMPSTFFYIEPRHPKLPEFAEPDNIREP